MFVGSITNTSGKMNTQNLTTTTIGTSIINPFGSAREVVTLNSVSVDVNDDGDTDYLLNVTDATGKTFNVITPDAEVEIAA